MFEAGRQKKADIFLQGSVAICAGVVFIAILFLPWLSTEYSAINGLVRARNHAAIVIPMTLMIIAVLTIFGGTIHLAGYRVGIQLATVMSALAFFISVMVIIVTLASANDFEGKTLNLLIGPWIGVAGAIFAAISSKLERI